VRKAEDKEKEKKMLWKDDQGSIIPMSIFPTLENLLFLSGQRVAVKMAVPPSLASGSISD